MRRPRVVVTGVGAVSPLGSNVSLFWEGLLRGHSGVRRITSFDPSGFPCQIAGEIPDFKPEDYLSNKEIRRTPRSGQIALAAAKQAVLDAGLPDKMPDPERSAVVFGIGIGGLDVVEDGIHVFHSKGLERVNPFSIPTGIPNYPAFVLAHHFQCLGPCTTLATACASSTQAIGEAAELIRRGAAEVVITGGTDSLIRDFPIAGFLSMRILPLNYNDQPERASRPFDALREGFVFSEGAGVLVLERLEHAEQRQARIYAELIGHASSSDGYHMAAPDPNAGGPIRAMRWALQDAELSPTEVEYINAHGTSTPINDLIETRAIKKVFGGHAYKIPISSTKSMIGHSMGGSGALEAITCLLSISNGYIHPTINYENPDSECDLDYVPNYARKKDIKVALSNSFGLGGQNACLLFKKFSWDGDVKSE
ncbi:MAG: beta-ketoacyl-ACP synthase II [Anaerolineales bacterium]